MNIFNEEYFPLCNANDKADGFELLCTYRKNLYSTHLTEAYAGKRPQMLEIEKQVGLLRRYVHDRVASKTIYEQANAIGESFAKVFNFKKVFIAIDLDKYENAGSILQVSYMNPLSANIKIGTDGIQDLSKSLVAICSLSTGILENDKLTDAELVAVIIHEFGHTLDSSEWRNMESFSVFFQDNHVLFDMLKERNGAEWVRDLEKYLAKHHEKVKNQKISDIVFNRGNSQVSVDREYGVNKDSKSMLDPKPSIFRVFLNKMFDKKGLGRNMERIADNVAGLYGYGYEIISALSKMDSKYNMKYIIASADTNIIGRLFREIFYTLSVFKDEHDQTIVRAQFIINKLKTDVKTSSYPPEAKTALLSDIEKLEAFIKGNPKDPRILTRMYIAVSWFMSKYLFKGGNYI